MSVKICRRASEHYVDHMRLHFCYKTFVDQSCHWNIDSDCSCDRPAFISCNKDDRLTFKYSSIVQDYFSYFALYLLQAFYRCFRVEFYTQLKCSFIVSESGCKRVCMSVCRTPACTDHIVRKIWADFFYFFLIDHSDIKSYRFCGICKSFQFFHMLRSFSHSQISFLGILCIYSEFF